MCYKKSKHAKYAAYHARTQHEKIRWHFYLCWCLCRPENVTDCSVEQTPRPARFFAHTLRKKEPARPEKKLVWMRGSELRYLTEMSWKRPHSLESVGLKCTWKGQNMKEILGILRHLLHNTGDYCPPENEDRRTPRSFHLLLHLGAQMEAPLSFQQSKPQKCFLFFKYFFWGWGGGRGLPEV